MTTSPTPRGATELEERDFVLEDARDPLRTIRGRVSLPGGTKGGAHLSYVLVLHGFKGFMDWGFFPELARRLTAGGVAVVRFNFSGSGHGAQPLEFTEHRAFFENTPSRELEDVERVRAWLDAGPVFGEDSAPEIDAKRGALLGHSLGGAMALLHAARRGDYRALVCWATVASLRRVPREMEELWRRQGFLEVPNLRTKAVHRLGLGWLEDIERNAGALDILAACRSLTAPARFFHGKDDEAVPLSEGESLARACAPGLAQLDVIPQANHTFGAVHPFAGVPPALEHVLRATAVFLDREL